MEARKIGEKLCQKSGSEWVSEQLKDETGRTVVDVTPAGISVEDITEEVVPDTVKWK